MKARGSAEKARARSRVWYLNNYATVRARMAERQKTEPAKEWFRQYNQDPATWTKRACYRLRAKAKKLNIEFDIQPEDLQMPATCPFTLLPFDFGCGGKGHSPQSPSVDRIKPDRGYVRGNVRIISVRANIAKSDITDPAVFDRLAADARLWGLV